MIISDLNYLENVSEDKNIQGGYAFADASAGAYAKGKYFASTYTSTYTSAISKRYYKKAESYSYSSSAAH